MCNPGLQNGARGSSKNTKIELKWLPAQGSENKDGKSCGKVHFPESWICNPHTPVQSKHTFLCSRFGRKNDQKSLPKAPQNRPKIIKKRLSSLSRIHAEKADTQNAKNAKKCRKWTSKVTTPFARKTLQNHKKSGIPSKWAPRPPQASKMSPWASKIAQNH